MPTNIWEKADLWRALVKMQCFFLIFAHHSTVAVTPRKKYTKAHLILDLTLFLTLFGWTSVKSFQKVSIFLNNKPKKNIFF